MQYITPNGGPKSANHVDPNSRNCLPNWHSETIKKNRLVYLNIINSIFIKFAVHPVKIHLQLFTMRINVYKIK